MSDEPNPPPLRLKPRLRPDDASAADTPAPQPETPPPAETTRPAEGEAPKLRLKPRLAPDPVPENSTEEVEAKPIKEAPAKSGLHLKPKLKLEPEPTPEATSSEPASAAEPPAPEAVKPAPTPVPPPPPAAEAAPPTGTPFKFKLKAKTPGASTPPIEVPPAAPPAGDAPPPPPKLGLKKPETPETSETPEDSSDEAAPKSAPKKRRLPGKPPKVMLMLVILIVVLSVAGIFAWKIFLAPASPPVIAPRPEVAKPQPETSAEPTSVPGQLIAKVKDLAAEHDISLTDPLDEVMDSDERLDVEEGIELKPAVADTPIEEEVSATTQSQISAGITATTTTVMEAVEASQAFQSYVAELSINGVFQGSPARALINGRTFSEGDVVDIALGIKFDHIETSTRSIIFRDLTGATVKRRY